MQTPPVVRPCTGCLPEARTHTWCRSPARRLMDVCASGAFLLYTGWRLAGSITRADVGDDSDEGMQDRGCGSDGDTRERGER